MWQSFAPSSDGVAANDVFTLVYSDRKTMTMSKAELIEKLTSDEDNKRLETDPRWKLRTKVVCWRFVAFSHFMEDVHEQLAILSKSFQSNSLIVYDISRNVNKTLKALQKLGEKVGTSGTCRKPRWLRSEEK